MTRRELVASIVFALLVALSMYQCGAAANDRALKAAALDSLDASKVDRARLRAMVSRTLAIKTALEVGNAQLSREVDSITLRARLERMEAGRLRSMVRAHEREIVDTTTTVPVDWFNNAVRAADRFEAAYQDADSARQVLAEIVASDSAAKVLLVAALDSVKATLAREDSRTPAIEAGVRAGSDRCGIGPWKVIPCVSRRVAFVGGVGAGLVIANNTGWIKRAVR